jgi:lipid II:glycine glycyltransferase (peptidoglycan interpeptide bridge formation enzyme)
VIETGAAAVTLSIDPLEVTDAQAAPPADWNQRTVTVPGGAVHQSTVNAAHRAAQGWQPHFVTFTDGRSALVLTRRRTPLPGLLAYVPRGPAPAGDAPASVARRVLGIAGWARTLGVVVLAADPILGADDEYERILAAAGFGVTEELHAERNRMVLRYPPGATLASVLAGVAPATRQVIKIAERNGLVAEAVTDDASIERFTEIYVETARRRRFWIGHVGPMVEWWRRLIDAGLGTLLVARHEERMLGGMVLYHQGGGYFMAHAGDDADARRELPGASHLLVWDAIRRGVEAGHSQFDMGGVEAPGHRRIPGPEDSTYGLYKYKRSFGAAWTDCAAAHEIVLRPWVHLAFRSASATRRLVRRRRPPR